MRNFERSVRNRVAVDSVVFDRHELVVRSYCRDFPAVFVRGLGPRVWDKNDNEYIDFLSGAGALNYGHNHPVLQKALIWYIQDNGITHSLDLYTGAKRRFIEALVSVILKPRGLDYRIQFTGEPWRRFQPYKGLPAFGTTDAAFFFSREKELGDILELLSRTRGRIVTLIGQSGVGKSSLAFAGILSRLKSQLPPVEGVAWPAGLKDSQSFLQLTMRPGPDPLKELAACLVRLYGETDAAIDKEASDWADRFRAGSLLRDMLRLAREKIAEKLAGYPPKGFILYVDQSEELYTRTPIEDARVFSRLLANATEDNTLSVLMSLTGTSKTGAVHRYYACSTCAQKGKTICKGRSIPMAKLDNLVTTHMTERLFQPERLAVILSSLSSRRSEKADAVNARVIALQREVTDADGKLKRLYRLIEDGMTEMDDVLKDRLISLKGDRERAMAALERAKSHSSLAIQIDPALLVQFGRSMRENFTTGSIPFRKAYLQSLIDVVEVDDAQIRIKAARRA